MIKRVIHTAITLAVLLVSCRQDDLPDSMPTAHEGYVALRFSADIPAMQEVVTRSVDPDGGGVQDMTLFCFDSYGLFTTTVEAKVTPTGNGAGLTGNFEAEVPENTRTVHFLANQNMSEFKEDKFRNKSEAEVMALLEGSSGRMIYWARFTCDPDNDSKIDAQMADKGNTIKMIRNHAQVSIDNPINGWIEVTGFVAYNTNAFGTVAPYHPEKGFDFEWPGEDDPFVTLPQNDARMSDITDVTTATKQYIFESENSADDPVSIIIRGHVPGESTEKYYRVMLIDEKGDQILIRRNHHYKLNIKGALSFGQENFAAALTAAATNNVWISISDEVNEVEDQNYILTVEKTGYVIDGDATGGTGNYTLSYTVKGKNGTTITKDDKADVSWIDNLVARQNIDNSFEIEDGIGKGSIVISLLPLGNNEKLEGTLLVKKGRLQRKIKVITVKRQAFTPSWVGTQVYGKINENNPTEDRSHVTVMFTIPETCPDELFPMKVYLSANELDIRYEAGMALPVVRNGDKEWYSSGDIKTEPDYKFLYTVEQAGVQRVYFENILSQAAGYKGTLYIEAEHFETMTREFTFSDTRKSITVTGLKAYSADPTQNPDGYADDEYVLYRLVPQKVNAKVQFDLQLMQKQGDEVEDDQRGTPFNAGEKDEFLLYSQYLSDYKDPSEADIVSFDCNFYTDEADTWWRKNNPAGGRMLMFKPIKPGSPTETGKYSIYMYTNRAKSAEVVRIASNQPGNEAVLAADAGDMGIYAGNSYRSVTFELANYNPFRFGARVKYAGEDWKGKDDEPDRSASAADIPEVVTPLVWTYQPEQEVDIAIDVTSFCGSDGNSVDPFGNEFEIYIDAPMLKIDENRLAANKLNGTKLKADPAVPGRFIYTVEADREAERNYGTNAIENIDNTTTISVNQNGERKTLPFITNSIVSAGDITISSNEKQVVYYSKTFRVTNRSITGTLRYAAADGVKDVPVGAFVSFERVGNNSRIGSVTVTADGRYELRLRREYEFNWYSDKIELHYEDTAGNVYHKIYDNLAELFAKPDIELQAAIGN